MNSNNQITDITTKQESVGTMLADIKPEKVEWLWQGRMPRGKITILEGDPGLGKSVLTVEIAARVSRGELGKLGRLEDVGELENDENLENLPAGVVLMTGEDGLADTVRPRFDAAGGNCNKMVCLFDYVDDKGQEQIVTLPRDLVMIEKAIQQVDAKLLIIDPMEAFIAGDPNANKDIRKALTPVKNMAEQTGVSVLLVRHLNKDSNKPAMYRGGGSIAITGVARSGLVLSKHPDDEELRVLAPQKNNLSKKASSLVYTIVTAENDTAKLEWRGESTHTADELVGGGVVGEEQRAISWLKDMLADGPIPAREMKEKAENEGISDSTLHRAKPKAGVQSNKEGSRWYWYIENVGSGLDISQAQEDTQGSQHAQEENVFSLPVANI